MGTIQEWGGAADNPTKRAADVQRTATRPPRAPCEATGVQAQLGVAGAVRAGWSREAWRLWRAGEDLGEGAKAELALQEADARSESK